ncbi:MAG: DUF262 domain-containing protein [Deltaproteobacteria bacterium]
MSIAVLLEEIRRDEIVLPAIQRDFVWSEGKIEKLLDSIMRGYPIGIIFLWETYNDIRHRLFTRDFCAGAERVFQNNPAHRRLKLVLDGQQRLQALYTALYGEHEGKALYFDALSGRDEENFREDKFIFRFSTEREALVLNERSRAESGSGERRFYLRVQELISLGAWERQRLERELDRQMNLCDEDKLRLSFNLSALRDAIFLDRNLLKVTTIDEYKPRESRDRKSESDILEAFMRINREATPLSRSDLFFSMLKLNWEETTETLPEFVRDINQGNSFGLDADFVIRSLLTVSDLGGKFDVDLLRSRRNVESLKANFSRCCRAVAEALDIAQNLCGIKSGKLLKSPNNLLPIIYYLFHASGQPHGERENLKKAVYLLALASPLSRSPESRIEKLIDDILKPALMSGGAAKFPLKETLEWAANILNFASADADFIADIIGKNPALALRLVQGESALDDNAPDLQFIFPAAELRRRGIEAEEASRFANLWIPNGTQRGRRAMKGSPAESFKSIPDEKLDIALIDRKLLDYKRYRKFAASRETKIVAFIWQMVKP